MGDNTAVYILQIEVIYNNQDFQKLATVIPIAIQQGVSHSIS